MDQPAPDPARLAESLRDLAWLNTWLGGTASVVHGLRGLLERDGFGPVSVLDVGTGAADIPLALVGRARRRGGALEAVGLERGGETVRFAAAALERAGAEAVVRLVRGDGLALPFRSGAFDVTISSTTLHHFSPAEVVAVLREMARVSAVGVVVSDLRRGWGGWIAASVLARTLWRRHPYARHDGPASVRAAYTPREAKDLALRAGLEGCEVEPRPGFRWVLRWWRSDA